MISDRFNEGPSYEIIGKFDSLKQTGTVMGLVKRDNPSLVDDYFTTSFVAGLKDPIQHHLQCHKPNSITQAFRYAKRLEQVNPVQKKFLGYNPAFKQAKP
jgi:hypothetical protein